MLYFVLRGRKEHSFSEIPSESTQTSPIPSQAPSYVARGNIPPHALVNCHRSPVEAGCSDYRTVENLLCSSPGQDSIVINLIEKIVNDDLWEKFKG